MLARWPIRNKLILGIALLLVIVVSMSASGFQGTYAYRELVRSISSRASELPLATALSKQVSDLRVSLADLEDLGLYPQIETPTPAGQQMCGTFQRQFADVRQTVKDYRQELDRHAAAEFRIGDPSLERDALLRVDQRLLTIEQLASGDTWYLDGQRTSRIAIELEQLQTLATELPSYLQGHMHDLAGEVRSRYRAWLVISWFGAIAATGLLLLFIFLCYRWVFRPLRCLVKGSRKVAAGDFNYRIEVISRDEIGELAESMNEMTARFREIRDDLDRQVQLRTKQVVRSEQLASVGFLAAGVAHEINNPLASIAMCAESLEGRLAEVAASDPEQAELMQRYLKMIQSEAFRCKEITEKLLDFSRMGEVKRQSTDLGELVGTVIDMVRHLGKYQDRKIEFDRGQLVIAQVSPQEIKQVVLNLVTNALDSLESGGTLNISLRRTREMAELTFADNGCGMTPDVLQHLFEPFFTRKRVGQGTGLGLSIVYRIVTDHGGQIEATSAGSGKGSTFHVTLPLAEVKKQPVMKENSHRYQAA